MIYRTFDVSFEVSTPHVYLVWLFSRKIHSTHSYQWLPVTQSFPCSGPTSSKPDPVPGTRWVQGSSSPVGWVVQTVFLHQWGLGLLPGHLFHRTPTGHVRRPTGYSTLLWPSSPTLFFFVADIVDLSLMWPLRLPEPGHTLRQTMSVYPSKTFLPLSKCVCTPWHVHRESLPSPQRFVCKPGARRLT